MPGSASFRRNVQHTYLLETAGRKVVLRLGPVNRHLLLPYEYHLMAAEAGVQELLHKYHIPTSHMIVCDTEKKILDRDIMIVEYIASRSTVTADLNQKQKTRIFCETGKWAREIHKISAAELQRNDGKVFGRYALVLAGQGCTSWKEALLREL